MAEEERRWQGEEQAKLKAKEAERIAQEEAEAERLMMIKMKQERLAKEAKL